MTRLASEAFVRVLPANKELPKICPDGEGGLMLVWQAPDNDDHTFMLTVHGMTLHGVTCAGTPNAECIDDIPFEPNQGIPQRILDCIPNA